MNKPLSVLLGFVKIKYSDTYEKKVTKVTTFHQFSNVTFLLVIF